jgi:hypothetical protein
MSRIGNVLPKTSGVRIFKLQSAKGVFIVIEVAQLKFFVCVAAWEMTN